MKRIKSMRGLEIYKTNDGSERVGIVYYNNKGALREMVGAVTEDKAACSDVALIRYRKALKGKYRDCPVCVGAVRLVAERRAAVRAAKTRKEPYKTPKEQTEDAERQRAESAKVAADARTPLLFEEAVKRFTLARGQSYSTDAFKGYLRNLGKAFAGRYLDTITKAEVAQYYRDRRHNAGPFADWPHKGGIRPAENDLVQFSALYTFLTGEEEHEIRNPCSGYRSGAGKMKAETYTPERTPYTASDAEVAAIFKAASRKNMPRFASHLNGDPLRAFFMVCHYTGGRTESEPCALRHGDVTFSDPNVVSTSGRKAMGQIRIRKAKNARSNRDLPMHPDLEDDLKAVMLKRPEDPTEIEAWAALPIFRQRDAKKAWTTSSYKKGWAAILAKLAKAHPGLGGMVVRDFRDLARTKLTDARIPEPVIRRWMGHAGDVSQRYYQVTTRAMEEAAEALTLSTNRTSDRTSKNAVPTDVVAHASNS